MPNEICGLGRIRCWNTYTSPFVWGCVLFFRPLSFFKPPTLLDSMRCILESMWDWLIQKPVGENNVLSIVTETKCLRLGYARVADRWSLLGRLWREFEFHVQEKAAHHYKPLISVSGRLTGNRSSCQKDLIFFSFCPAIQSDPYSFPIKLVEEIEKLPLAIRGKYCLGQIFHLFHLREKCTLKWSESVKR